MLRRRTSLIGPRRPARIEPGVGVALGGCCSRRRRHWERRRGLLIFNYPPVRGALSFRLRGERTKGPKTKRKKSEGKSEGRSERGGDGPWRHDAADSRTSAVVSLSGAQNQDGRFVSLRRSRPCVLPGSARNKSSATEFCRLYSRVKRGRTVAAQKIVGVQGKKNC